MNKKLSAFFATVLSAVTVISAAACNGSGQNSSNAPGGTSDSGGGILSR